MDKSDLNTTRLNSDAKWYIDQCGGEREEYYRLFFQALKTYRVNWRYATPQERFFIEEVTRVAFERQQAKKNGCSTADIRPAFTKSA